MFFRIFRRGQGPLVRGDTPRERLLRTLGLMLVFALVAWAFQWNTQRHLTRLKGDETVEDRTGRLSPRQRAQLGEFARRFKAEFGQEPRLYIGPDVDALPAPGPTTILLALDPAARRVRLEVPPLAARALGPEFLRHLRQEHFLPHFEADTWPDGLAMALSRIWDALAATPPDLAPPGPVSPGPVSPGPIAPGTPSTPSTP